MTSIENPTRVHHWGNISYILNFLWQRSPFTIPLSFIAALCEVLSPFITIFLPKLIIDGLQIARSSNVTDLNLVEDLFQKITIAIALLLLTSVVKNIARTIVQVHSMQNRFNLLIETENKTATMDYANYENPAGQTARQKAYDALSSVAGGGETVVAHSTLFVAHLLGLCLYFYVISSLHLGIMLLMIFGSILSFWVKNKAQKYEVAQRDEQADLMKKRNYIHDRAIDYQNAKDIRLYDMSAWLQSLMESFLNQIMKLRHRTLSTYLGADSMDIIVACVRDGLAYAYLIGQVLSGNLTVGDCTLFLAVITGISNWINLLMEDLHWILRGSRDIGYVRAYLAIPDRPHNDQGLNEIPSSQPEIIFEHVSFRYPGSETWILQDISLRISPGEKIALVGVNGAGKTTCVKLLTGLYQPTAGRILINGVESSRYQRDAYFKLFTTVFQEVRILAMDIAHNVALCPSADIDEARVLECLHLAGLDETMANLPQGIKTPLTRVLADDGLDLSGGQAQKLMLARALYRKAPVIILDEPTAALDPIAEASQYHSYNDLIGQKTSLFISHRLASTRFCDKIALLEDGNITELGSHNELMQLNGFYANMFKTQAQYYQDEAKESVG